MQKEIVRDWSNNDNHAFYDNMTLDFFVAGAKRSGLANGEDVKQIKNLILHAESILEVGAGYGRVLKHILELDYKGSLDAVEYEKQYYDFCFERYSDKVALYHADILQWQAPKKYDLILSMWSSFTEFCEQEQRKLFRVFAGMLQPGGKLVVELLNPSAADKDRMVVDGDYCQFTYERPGGYLFFPAYSNLVEYAADDFSGFDIIQYKVNETVDRNICIFSRASF